MTDDVEDITSTLNRVMQKAQEKKGESDKWARETNEAFEQQRREEWRAPRLAVIPVRYRDAEVEGKELQSWLAHVLDGGWQGLGLAGPTGTGKSYSLWALYRVLIDAKVNAIAVNLIEYLDSLRPGGTEESLTIEKLVRAPVLLLDDLGVHKSSDWTDERVYRIINSRYENVKPTVFTTNHPVDEWVEVLGERVAWRLIEDCRIVEMRGRNRRQSA